MMVLFSDLLGDAAGTIKGSGCCGSVATTCWCFTCWTTTNWISRLPGRRGSRGSRRPDYLNCNPRALREGYLEALQAFLEEVRRGCAQQHDRLRADPYQPTAGCGAGDVPEQPAGNASNQTGCRSRPGNGGRPACRTRIEPMQFVHQPLTWGFLLVLLPLLIHLINMMRHRRVKWAAMEFLLQSYKKHRKWIWLKQLLLLLVRMARWPCWWPCWPSGSRRAVAGLLRRDDHAPLRPAGRQLLDVRPPGRGQRL